MITEPAYRPLEWSQVEDGEWTAFGTVYSASDDWDPFEFRVREWRGLWRFDGTASELIPDTLAAAVVCATLDAAKRTCEDFNRTAFTEEFGSRIARQVAT